MITISGINLIPIPTHPEYYISECCRVYSTISNKFLLPSDNGVGYIQFNIASKKLLASRLLAHTFLTLEDLYDQTLEVDHVDRDPQNNALSNLQVLTKKAHRAKTDLDNSTTGNIVPRYRPCTSCGSTITHKNLSGICRACAKTYTEDLDLIIETLIAKKSWTQAAKEFGISDNGLRKRYKTLSGRCPKTFKFN